MAYVNIIWNEESGGNIGHIAQHGLTPEDVEEVLFNPVDQDASRTFRTADCIRFCTDTSSWCLSKSTK